MSEKKKITASEDIPEFHESLKNMPEETKQRVDSKLKAITEACTLTDAELIAACENWIDRLCKSGGDAWTLEVPVNMNRDPDMLFAELVQRFYKAKSEPPAEQPVRDVDDRNEFAEWCRMQHNYGFIRGMGWKCEITHELFSTDFMYNQFKEQKEK